MKKILLFGAGKSATCLIEYLLKETSAQGWELMVAENNLSLARAKIGDAKTAKAVAVNVEDTEQRDRLVKEADIVISLLPPSLHILVARSCLQEERNLLTASYTDPAIREAAPVIAEKGLLFLYEMGLDPGIDHMSAMELIHRIRTAGGRIHSFKSHTGGLVAPSSDTNPWHYKISWNPRNVVMAGSGGAVFKENGGIVTKTYRELFKDCPEVVLEGVGPLSWYPNRDSLGYIPVYGLEDTATFIRTTLRYRSFCEAWSALVDAGLTDDQVSLDPGENSLKGWSRPVLPFINSRNREALEFLGISGDEPLPPRARVSADVLQYLLETRLAMEAADKDMIVMLHELDYEAEGRMVSTRSSLIVEGEDALRTAMARTVGYPLGIAAKLVLQGKIGLKGLHIPILPEIYVPLLRELASLGIAFKETNSYSPLTGK